MKFLKFRSLDNLYNAQGIVTKFENAGLSNSEYVVMEKIHGANFAFYSNGEEVQCAKRTSILEPDESFFGWQGIHEKYAEKLNAFVACALSYIEYEKTYFIFCGELYGGNVQKNMPYPKHKDFALFDAFHIVPKTPKNDRLISEILDGGEVTYYYDETIDSYVFTVQGKTHFFDAVEEVTGIKSAPVLFTGSLSECLGYEKNFESLLLCEEAMKLEGLERGTEAWDYRAGTEGVVISMNFPVVIGGNQLLYIKNKTERFEEKKREPKTVVTQEQSLMKLNHGELLVFNTLISMITEPRYEAVISKIGEVDIKQFGAVLKAFIEDCFEDLNKELALLDVGVVEFKQLEESKRISKHFNAECTQFIRNKLLGK